VTAAQISYGHSDGRVETKAAGVNTAPERPSKGDVMKQWAARMVMVGVVLVAVTAAAQDTPSGQVVIESKSIALGIGVSWGDGKLTYQGREHPFSVNGLSVVDVGISRVTATGNVYKLKDVADFSGNYTAAAAGATVGGGKGVVAMQNQNGVVMELTSTSTGVQFTLAPTGVEIKMK
jgi:hypothetical protein